MLSDDQLLRYSRHIFLPDIDIRGQQALADARVLVLGAGGLGSPVLLYLAAAGVGHLVISDPDVVELSNLQRQIVHDSEGLNQSKVESARHRLLAMNPEIQVTALPRALDDQELLRQVQAADVVVVGTDNFASRHAANRACLQARIPLLSAAAIAWEGQISTFDSRREDSPCFACLYPDSDDQALNCAEAGVVSPLVGVLGSYQALEVIKLITGAGEPLVGRLQLFDGKSGEWQTLRLKRNPQCAVCSKL
ncbi:MAG: molybdopterin-synthase adenylyltransferase MoeB [Natronospirillum sp.]|uniref:HesA/MoeB/ThiF family protein n=1 Tax=Natronospirillum sp. TaxID=2812955 RepID=UPI0025D7F1F3|nr:molybdopterin-synthase adenylyltransferase MoeB [Natronospirillum sp.]MCH8553083.1 molybdopterin-synthase adenylyltransferase MoeB [Natronospirillum sp.]